jgi:hypothetical protein
MFNVATLAPVLHLLFTSRANELARAAGFVRRVRCLTGADFLRALVFGYLKRRTAPLEDLAQPLGISRQALDQRFTEPAARFCREALREAVGHVLQAQPQALAVLRPFPAVYLDDCTQLALPAAAAADFPGCGSGRPEAGKAGLKVFARWEIRQGRLDRLDLHPARTSDHTALAQAAPLPAGCLHLADLGFADFGRLRDEAAQGISWISRLPAQTRLGLPGQPSQPLWQQLYAWRQQGRTAVDTPAQVGDKQAATGRLVAFACPQEVADRRLRKAEESARRRGRPLSARQRELCRWTVFFSNVAVERLSAADVWQVYRLRWQVELLFKRFKSEGGLDATSSGKRYRVECEWYVKLLGQVIRNWLQLLRGGPLRDVNGRQLGRVIADGLDGLRRTVGTLALLVEILSQVEKELQRVRARTRRRQHPTAAQRLEKQTDGLP